MIDDSLLADMAHRLTTAGIPFMVVGSRASSIHGRQRGTNDVDIVIDPAPPQLEGFLAGLGNRFYVSPDAAREALRSRSMFNVIDFESGLKADLIVRKDQPFGTEAFRRRQVIPVAGLDISVATAEDIILSKLEWHLITPSDRQLSDVFGVISVQGDRLDRGYLRAWAARLGVADLLEAQLRQADAAQMP